MVIKSFHVMDYIRPLKFLKDDTILIEALIQNHLYKDHNATCIKVFAIIQTSCDLRKNLVGKRKHKKLRAPTHHPL